MSLEIRDIVFVYQLKTPELVWWHSRHHHHRPGEYELHYFLHGEARFEKGAERYIVTPGTLHFSPPLEHHAVKLEDHRRPISFYAVLFAPDPDDPVADVLADREYRDSFPRHVGSRYRILFEDLKNRYTHARRARRRAAVHTLQSLLWDLAAESEVAEDEYAASVPGDAGDVNVHVRRAIHLFESHIHSRITVADVAERVGITQAHLTRLFTEQFGVPPRQ